MTLAPLLASVPRQSRRTDTAQFRPDWSDEHRPPSPRVLVVLSLWAAAGVLILAVAFRLAAEGASPWMYSPLFWLGLLVAVLPAAAQLISAGALRSHRLWALLTVVAATGVPRLLRAPSGPLFPDEFAAWRQTLDVTAGTSWHLHGGLVPGVEGFPGLSLLVGGVSSLSGLSVWSAAVLVLLVARLLGAVAVFSLAESLLGTSRRGGAATLIYLLNPVALYGETRLAADSVAVPLVLVALAFAARAAASSEPALRRGLTVGAAVSLGLVAVTDPTVASMGVAVFLAVAIAATLRTRQHPVQLTVRADRSVRRRRIGIEEFPAVWWALTAVAVAALGAMAVAQLATSGSFVSSGDWFPSRGLFGSPGRAPAIEAVLALAAQLLMLVLAADAAWRLWLAPRRHTGQRLALSGLGLLYFPLAPVALLPSLPMALRSAWALTYLGVALLTAPLVPRVVDVARERVVIERAVAGPLVALALAVVLIGNAAAGVGAGYRYPGPDRYGVEGRADLVELRSIATAFAADTSRVGILTDRYTGPAFVAYSGDQAARAPGLLPGNELMQGVDPTTAMLTSLVSQGYGHLVVDTRMADADPADGPSFGPDDPANGRVARMTALLRLDRVPWVSRVATSEHYRVYRLDVGGAGLPLVPQADGWGANYQPLPGTPGAVPNLPASTSYGQVVPGAAGGGAGTSGSGSPAATGATVGSPLPGVAATAATVTPPAASPAGAPAAGAPAAHAGGQAPHPAAPAKPSRKPAPKRAKAAQPPKTKAPKAAKAKGAPKRANPIRLARPVQPRPPANHGHDGRGQGHGPADRRDAHREIVAGPEGHTLAGRADAPSFAVLDNRRMPPRPAGPAATGGPGPDHADRARFRGGA
jgi:hypothetical protein